MPAASPLDPRLMRLAFALSLTLALVAGWLMLAPFRPGPPLFPHQDKVNHALAFFAICLPVATVDPGRWRSLATLTLGYGALIELIQPRFGRSAEWWDLFADAVGIALAIWAGRVLHPRLARLTPRRA